MFQNIKIWLMASRPKTLTASVFPILTATALVRAQGYEVKWWITSFALMSALCIQIATNFINDLIDHEKGADTSERIGPARVSQRGLVVRKKMIFAIGFILTLALLFGLPLVYSGGWPIVIIGVISMLLAYSYTGGPFPLAYLGLGDIFVILFFGVIAVCGVYYLQVEKLDLSALILGLQIGLLSTVLIAINNLRDVHQDRKAHKKTLPVRWGITFARFEIYLLLLLPFAFQYFWFDRVGLWAVFLPFIFLPLAIFIIYQIAKHEPSAKYNQFLAQSALLHGGFGLLISVGLYLT